jgi:Caspase domain
MEPVFDAREEHAGQPGLHALIVGISRYPNLPEGRAPTEHQQRYGLGLSQLSAAARTGLLVYEWLLEDRLGLPAPLVTCRLLLSPAADELEDVDQPEQGASDVTLKSVLEAAKGWREDAASCSDNVTLFYFAGHGLQRKRGDDHVLILEDFGDGIGGKLKNAVDTLSLIEGMAPSEDYPDIARRQFYFFDACRMPSNEAYKYEDQLCTPVFDTPTLQEDDRVVPTYQTASPGMAAFAIPGEQTLFSKALLRCLRGGGAEKLEGRWCVTVASLYRGLEHHMAVLEKEYKARQRFFMNNVSENVVLHCLAHPPSVDVDFEVVPEHLAPKFEVKVNDLHLPEATFGPPLDPYPFSACLKAGEYVVTSRVVEPPSKGKPPRDDVVAQRIESVAPPRQKWLFEV